MHYKKEFAIYLRPTYIFSRLHPMNIVAIFTISSFTSTPSSNRPLTHQPPSPSPSTTSAAFTFQLRRTHRSHHHGHSRRQSGATRPALTPAPTPTRTPAPTPALALALAGFGGTLPVRYPPERADASCTLNYLKCLL